MLARGRWHCISWAGGQVVGWTGAARARIVPRLSPVAVYTPQSERAPPHRGFCYIPEVVLYIKTIFQPFNCRPSVPSLSVWPLINNTLYLPLLHVIYTHYTHTHTHTLCVYVCVTFYTYTNTLVHTSPVRIRSVAGAVTIKMNEKDWGDWGENEKQIHCT